MQRAPQTPGRQKSAMGVEGYAHEGGKKEKGDEFQNLHDVIFRRICQMADPAKV
jgi:hypothetical protein